MYVQFHSVKEQSKNHDIWFRGLFDSLRGKVQFGFGCSVRFLVKPGFLFGSFLLGFGSFPSVP